MRLRSRILRIVLVAWITVAFSMTCSASAAEKPNETLIKELHEADKALNAAFKKAQRPLDEKGKQALRKEQIEWLKLRDKHCGSAFKAKNMEEWLQHVVQDVDRYLCVNRHIEKRTEWLSGHKRPAGKGESIRFDSEAKKLDFIRATFAREKHVKPMEGNSAFCEAMRHEFSVGKAFTAIEPDVRADSPYDPRLWKWDACDGKDYTDVGVDVERFYGGLEWLGAPPYRYYRIELDRNPQNGLEDLIYHEESISWGPAYTWVDLSRCEVKGGFDVDVAFIFSSKKPMQLNSLLVSKQRIFGLSYVAGEAFSLTAGASRDDPKEACTWQLYQ